MEELEAEDWTFHIIKNCVTNNYLLLKMAHFDVSHTQKKDSSNKILNLIVIKEYIITFFQSIWGRHSRRLLMDFFVRSGGAAILTPDWMIEFACSLTWLLTDLLVALYKKFNSYYN